MFGEEIWITHKDNLVNVVIEKGNEANYDINKEEITEDGELRIIGAYVTEEDESNGHEKKEVMNKIIKQVTIV